MQVRKMQVTENASKENASKGKYKQWKMQVMENGNNGKCSTEDFTL